MNGVIKMFLFSIIMHTLYCAGISGIYKGLTATMMKQGSNQAIRFFVVESCKEWYKVSRRR